MLAESNGLDDSFRPLIRHAFPAQTSGATVWTFDLNFQRTDPENYYSFWMQLCKGALMSDTNPIERGVAVNLIWGSPSRGLTTHEGFGYVIGGAVRQIAPVSGGGGRRLRSTWIWSAGRTTSAWEGSR